MSGIFGVVQLREPLGPTSGAVALLDTPSGSKGRKSAHALARRMAGALVHRGAYVHVWSEGPAQLGHSGRSEHVAIHVEDEVVVTLAGTLEPDPNGEATTDLARVAAAWRRWGVDFPGHLHGEYVAAILERRTGRLHLVRDPSGLHPLYWARSAGSVAFASDLAPLLEVPWVSRELARENLAEYLSFRVVHPPRTLLRDVSVLPPGWRLRFDAEGVRTARAFTQRYAAPGTPVPREADVLPELTSAIERAVRRRISGEEPVGIYLSGGVGSAAVTAAARAASRSLSTFTVTFSEEPTPESPFAGRIASLLGMEHRTVVVGSRDIADSFDATIAAIGHPNGNVSAVLQLHLARAAAGSVGRVITGDGADQLFGGAMLEAPAEGLAKVLRFQQLPSPIRALARPWLARSERFSELLVDPRSWALEQGIGGVTLFDTPARRQLLLDGLWVRPGVRRDVLAPMYGAVDTDPLNAMMHAFYESQLVSDILPRVTGTAAAAGLRLSAPLLDREVVRQALLLPGAFKTRGLRAGLGTRWLLRALLRGTLPPALINRPDRHMPRPLDGWLVGPGRLFLEERLAWLREDPLGLWHHTGLEALRRGLLGRQEGASHKLWALFALESWVRQLRLT
jgi:asparagine synthase (glutamine-hydrolysing)